MAIYSKKSKDPTEIALSAIQDALNIRDADATAPAGAVADALDNANDMRTRAPRGAGRSGSSGAAREALDAPLTTPGGDDQEIARAANDDQESIGKILQSLQRRPASTAFIIASLCAATWAISALMRRRPLYVLNFAIAERNTDADRNKSSHRARIRCRPEQNCRR